MDNQIKVKNIIILTEGLDLSQNLPEETKLDHLNQLITEGNSTIVVDENQISKQYPLISLLGFGKTFNEGFKGEGKAQKGQPRFFTAASTAKKAGNDDEEVIEVKYISHPKKFSEVNDVSLLVVTESGEMADFCEVTEVSYLYIEDVSAYEEIRKAIQGSKAIDLLILHRKVESSKGTDALNSIEALLKNNTFNNDAIKLIFSPFCQNLPVGQLIKKQEEQLKNSDAEIQSALAKVIPQQTWQFYRGKVALESTETIAHSMLMINNRKELNRADTIRDIKEYANADSLGKLGGKVINCSGVLRETLFELGKLPKFGA